MTTSLLCWINGVGGVGVITRVVSGCELIRGRGGQLSESQIRADHERAAYSSAEGGSRSSFTFNLHFIPDMMKDGNNDLVC